MSLKEYAKKKKKENTSVITARIQTVILEQFKQHCNTLGITVSEAIQYLIQNEIQETEPKGNTKSIQPTPPSKENTKSIQPVIQEKDPFDNLDPNNPEHAALLRVLNEEPDPMDERYFYILRKTDKELDEVIEEDGYVTNSAIRWRTYADSKLHLDKNGQLIPFRYTNRFGMVVEPSERQLEELAKAYGKPVTIEK